MPKEAIQVEVRSTLKKLLDQEDSNGDHKITVEDRGQKHFIIHSSCSQKLVVSGAFSLSILLKLLVKADQKHQKYISISHSDLNPTVIEYLLDSIDHEYWNALTRKLDADGISRLFEDTKVKSKKDSNILYVPAKDSNAEHVFKKVAEKHPYLHLKVEKLPKTLSNEELKKLELSPGLLSLALDEANHAYPFIVPGGRFNEMYGWDSYFILLGLVEQNHLHLALSIIENCAYEIEHYGKVLNANRSYYLSRANPPLFTSMLKALMPHLKLLKLGDEWLARMVKMAIKEYVETWCNQERQTPIGLTRYYGGDLGPCYEVEENHYLELYQTLSNQFNVSIEEVEKPSLDSPIGEALKKLFIHDRAMRESGHDTSERLVYDAASLCPVDLNSLLYKYERDLFEIIEEFFPKGLQGVEAAYQTSTSWKKRAHERKEKIFKYLWNEPKGCFFDYHFVNKKPHLYFSMTNYYPLFAGLCNDELTEKLIHHALTYHEEKGGLVSTAKQSVKKAFRQWDYPFGWAPHQILFWLGCQSQQSKSDLQRLIYKWLYMICVEARDFAGVLVEKYDVVNASHKAQAEYGNEGLDFTFYPEEGFAWLNASVVIGYSMLTNQNKESLKKLIAPSQLN